MTCRECGARRGCKPQCSTQTNPVRPWISQGHTATAHEVIDHRVITGSCLDSATGLYSLPDKSVDVTIADPPYEAEAHSKGRRVKPAGWRDNKDGDGRAVVEAPLPFAAITEHERKELAIEMARVTRRWILVFCQNEAVPAWRHAMAATDATYIRTGVWVKPDAQPQMSGDRPGVGYETVVIFHRPGRKRWNGGGRVAVWTHSKSEGRGKAPHPTTKPQALMRELVALFSDPGEIVIDPTSGSGSTGVACAALGRRFLGWEINPEYAEIARRRIAGTDAMETAQLGLFG